MKNPLTVYNYLKAGNATVTLTDTRDGCWFTYRVLKNRTKGWGVFLMVQAEKYVYIGVIKKGMFHHTGGSKLTEDSKGFGIFDSLIIGLTKKWAIPSHVNVQHAGQCGRCGRKLTTPKSIEIGLGPDCMEIVYA
jgi:hypothetical protein